jgi:hypothetical protein
VQPTCPWRWPDVGMSGILGPSSISTRRPPPHDARDRIGVLLAKRPQPAKHVEEAGLAGRCREQVSETGAIFSRPASWSPRHPSLASRHAGHYRPEQQHPQHDLLPGLRGWLSGVSGSAKVETQSSKLDLALRSVDSQKRDISTSGRTSSERRSVPAPLREMPPSQDAR